MGTITTFEVGRVAAIDKYRQGQLDALHFCRAVPVRHFSLVGQEEGRRRDLRLGGGRPREGGRRDGNRHWSGRRGVRQEAVASDAGYDIQPHNKGG